MFLFASASKRFGRGEADAEVIQLTAEAYGKSPEFYEFLRRLAVFKKTLNRDTRLILSTESDLFRLLKGPARNHLDLLNPQSSAPDESRFTVKSARVGDGHDHTVKVWNVVV